MLKKQKDLKIHFVGIGGIGMSGIAEVFLNQGYHVSGSDIAISDVTLRLKDLGIRIETGHHQDHLQDTDVVVISSAVKADNPEVCEARRRRIPVIPRAEMLGELMRGKIGIGVAGSHGKTTTTSMLATVLSAAGLDPTIVIGGKVDALGGNAKSGSGNYVVAEADESDSSFLHLPVRLAIVTNIDNDHLDFYGTEEAIRDIFVNFVGKIPFYGLALVCGEDPGVLSCADRWTKPIRTYGFRDEHDWIARNLRQKMAKFAFDVFQRHHDDLRKLGEIELSVPGQHNVLNALAAVALASELEIPFPIIAQALKHFEGVQRRFQVCWSTPDNKRVIVDDYGHHPTEIMATLRAARDFWNGRILCVFQPHRYSRTLHCHKGFLNCFDGADQVMITDIYPAGEQPIAGVSSENLVHSIKQATSQRKIQPDQFRLTPSLQDARDLLLKEFRDGDLILCMGAGSITRLPKMLMEAMSE